MVHPKFNSEALKELSRRRLIGNGRQCMFPGEEGPMGKRQSPTARHQAVAEDARQLLTPPITTDLHGSPNYV